MFVSKDNKTVVIGIKGTSGAGLPGGGSDETGGNDKTNDNLLFSCCCAKLVICGQRCVIVMKKHTLVIKIV